MALPYFRRREEPRRETSGALAAKGRERIMICPARIKLNPSF